MQRVLDIDLDFFLEDCCPLAPLGERPELSGHEPWSQERVTAFLENNCLLNKETPLPGRIFDTHDKALLWWRELMEAGQLRPPFHVTHVDAHSDLGIGKPGPGFVLYNVLAKSPAERLRLEEFYAAHQLDEANYLLFALSTRCIGSLDNVRNPCSRQDIPEKIVLRNAIGAYEAIRLPQAFPELFEKKNGAEPLIPFHVYDQYENFQAEAPYDFVSVAISPRYAPREADALLPLLSSYMLFDEKAPMDK